MPVCGNTRYPTYNIQYKTNISQKAKYICTLNNYALIIIIKIYDKFNKSVENARHVGTANVRDETLPRQIHLLDATCSYFNNKQSYIISLLMKFFITLKGGRKIMAQLGSTKDRLVLFLVNGHNYLNSFSIQIVLRKGIACFFQLLKVHLHWHNFAGDFALSLHV